MKLKSLKLDGFGKLVRQDTLPEPLINPETENELEQVPDNEGDGTSSENPEP